uniref:Reverse transcriptase zinc-binding domain-containing protein n=1 Tax=Tanacetum cinerariifolium TaxID=118510 RepID=A0A6L2L6F7_TANCI|nr:hypothetical protein [Tanacetum cinerariifolium]
MKLPMLMMSYVVFDFKCLKTQDKLRAWDNVDWSNLKCALCELQPDSHEHLFFNCSFAQQVWNRVKDLAGLFNSSPSMDDILHGIAPFAKRRTLKSIVAKLVVAAAAYFIWQERNGRLFKESKLSVSQVSDNILNSVLVQPHIIFKDSCIGLNESEILCHLILSLVEKLEEVELWDYNYDEGIKSVGFDVEAELLLLKLMAIWLMLIESDYTFFNSSFLLGLSLDSAHSLTELTRLAQ